MTIRTRAARTLLATAGAGCLVTAVTAAPAQAASDATPRGGGQHCATKLETKQTTCFSSYRALVMSLSRGKVTDIMDPRQLTEAVVQRIAAASAAGSKKQSSVGPTAVTATNYVLSQIYADAGYSGSSYNIYSEGGCDTDAYADKQLDTMPTGWNDRVSSFHSFSQCQTKLYEDGYFGGATYGPYTDSSNVGNAMNDRTSSMKFY